MPAKERWCRWGDLRLDHHGLPTTGDFAVRAVLRTRVYLSDKGADAIEVALASNEVRVESKRARGEDARAVKLIHEHLPLPARPALTGNSQQDERALLEHGRELAYRAWERDAWIRQRKLREE